QVTSAGLARQQLEEGGDVLGIEFPERRELPEDRPELLAELEDAAFKEPVDALAGLGELAAVDDVAMALHREHEIVRGRVAPLAEARRRLGAVERAVDLDGGEAATRIAELIGLLEVGRIERPAPRRIGPAADPDSDHVPPPPCRGPRS